MQRAPRAPRLALAGAIVAAPLFLATPAPAQLDVGDDSFFDPSTLPWGSGSPTLLPAPSEDPASPGSPPAPSPSAAVPQPTAEPGGDGAGDPMSQLPIPPPGGEDGGAEEEAQDPCKEVTGPLTEGGAPIAASCTVTPTDEGGLDVELCLTIATIATCEASSEPTPSTTTPTTSGSTTTTTSGGGNGGNGTGGTGTGGGGASGAGDPSPGGGGGATLPFTGADVGALLALGTALASGGGLLNHLARRRGA
jgi:hypothetical protein